MSKCDVNIFIHDINVNLNNIDIHYVEIRKKGQNAINNKFTNNNNILIYDEINNTYNITNG